MKLKIFFSTLLALLILPSLAFATSTTFSLRLGQPKSPTNQDNFKLTFVALDSQESGRNITVKCFKKGPSDGSFSQFDSEKVLIEGGNTDYCDVNSSILNTNGTYEFYVTATADSTTLTSSTVSVNYNSSSPDSPSDYSKERVSSCDYKIKFKTANDGKTVKVQLFRSDNFSINVDSGAVIATKNIGPNQEGEIINSVPDCNKEYYFVIRAVDGSDNTSGTVGDRFTTTTTTSTTNTGGTSGHSSANGALTVSGSTSQVTSPESATPSGSSNQDVTKINEQGSSSSASILGTSTDKPNNLFKWLLVITLSYAGFHLVKGIRRVK